MKKEEYKAKKIEEWNKIRLGNWEDAIAGEAERFISQTIDELWANGKADMIVDLYQIKASLNRPLRLGEMEKPGDVYKYHFLMTIIAKLCEINDIRGEDIEEAIERRAEAERMIDLSIKGKR